MCEGWRDTPLPARRHRLRVCDTCKNLHALRDTRPRERFAAVAAPESAPFCSKGRRLQSPGENVPVGRTADCPRVDHHLLCTASAVPPVRKEECSGVELGFMHCTNSEAAHRGDIFMCATGASGQKPVNSQRQTPLNRGVWLRVPSGFYLRFIFRAKPIPARPSPIRARLTGSGTAAGSNVIVIVSPMNH